MHVGGVGGCGNDGSTCAGEVLAFPRQGARGCCGPLMGQITLSKAMRACVVRARSAHIKALVNASGQPRERTTPACLQMSFLLKPVCAWRSLLECPGRAQSRGQLPRPAHQNCNRTLCAPPRQMLPHGWSQPAGTRHACVACAPPPRHVPPLAGARPAGARQSRLKHLI